MWGDPGRLDCPVSSLPPFTHDSALSFQAPCLVGVLPDVTSLACCYRTRGRNPGKAGQATIGEVHQESFTSAGGTQGKAGSAL